MGTVPETLRAFGPTTLVVRAVDAVLATMGAQPPLGAVPDVAGVVEALAAAEGIRASVAAAEALALDATSERVLAIGAAVDGADRHLARTATPGPGPERPQGTADGPPLVELQAQDAALKLLAIAAIARTCGGLKRLPSGRALVAVWAAVDVALPLGGTDVARMMATHRGTQAIRLSALLPPEVCTGLDPVVDGLIPIGQRQVDAAVARVDGIAAALAPFVPGLLASSEGAAERIALQTDRLPVYKWLAARIAAEHAAMRASG